MLTTPTPRDDRAEFRVVEVFGVEYNKHLRINRGRNDGEFRRFLTADADLEVIRSHRSDSKSVGNTLKRIAGGP